MKFNRIVAYGCSFTAGEESADHIVYGIDAEELDKKKRSPKTDGVRSEEYLEFRKKIVKEKYKGQESSLNLELLKEGKKNSYIRYLADILDLPYSNRAVPGGSMEQMLFRIERDIFSEQIKNDDLVIVGLTTSGRFFNLIEEHKKYTVFHNYSEYSCVIGSGTLLTKEDREFLLKWDANIINIVWEYYRNIKHILLLSEKYKEKFKIIIVPVLTTTTLEVHHSRKNYETNKTHINLTNLFNIFKEIDTHENYLNTCDSIPYFKNFKLYDRLSNKLVHGRDHPTKELHEAYANYLYENFIKNILESDV